MTPQEETETYLKGTHNFFIRTYYYLEQGLNILNTFRNLFLAIIGVYISLKLSSVWWMVGMFAVSLVILALVGWYNVHHLTKVKEWLGIRFSTYYGIQSFNYTKKTSDTLEEIKKLLKKKK